MPGVLELDPAERHVIQTLSARHARYLVIGSHSMRVHGVRRFPKDLDVLIDRKAPNARRVARAMRDLGYDGDPSFALNLARPRKKVFVDRYGTDILTSIRGFSFNSLYRRRVIVRDAELSVAVVGRSHLLAIKASSNRPKDQRDYRSLLRNRRAG